MSGVKFKVTRDTITYTLGICGSIYMTVLAEGPLTERLPFLVIFAGLLVTPSTLRKDDRPKERIRAAKESEEAE